MTDGPKNQHDRPDINWTRETLEGLAVLVFWGSIIAAIGFLIRWVITV